MKRAHPALTLLVVALIAGCASKPPGRREVPAGTAASGGNGPVPTASNIPRRSGGGYYLDDGPGANPPPDLDLLPDAVPRVEKYASGANRPYNVFGVDYVPDLSGAAYRQRGVGSWYGRKFHGQRTSSGEIYDMYAMTAAHPTLPIPCYALVTNLQNGKSVIVRVNDRGPFLHSRVMDLSYAAALKLGYLSSGSGTIEVEMLRPADIAAGRIPITSNSLYVASAAAAGRKLDPGAPAMAMVASAGPTTPASAVASPTSPGPSPDSRPALATSPELPPTLLAAAAPTSSLEMLSTSPPNAPTPSGPVAVASYAERGIPADLIPDATPLVKLAETSTGGNFYLQLGAFRARAGADSFAAHVTREIDPQVASKVQVSDANGLYRVRIGPYAQRAEADSAASTLRTAIAQPVMVMPDAMGR